MSVDTPTAALSNDRNVKILLIKAEIVVDSEYELNTLTFSYLETAWGIFKKYRVKQPRMFSSLKEQGMIGAFTTTLNKTDIF